MFQPKITIIFDLIRRIKYHSPLLIPPIVSILIIWSPDFFEKGYINWGDTVFPFYPTEYFWGQYYLWNSYDTFGEPTYWTAHLPYYFFMAVADVLGLPLWVINRLIFILPISMMGWFTYYFTISIIKGKHQKVAGILASLFILFSPVITLHPKWNISIAAIPLILAFIIRGCENKQERKKYVLLAALSSFLIPIGDPQFILLIAGFVCIYFILDILLRWQVDLDDAKYLISIIFLSILVNMYWILPFISNLLTFNVLESRESIQSQGYSLLVGVAPWAKFFFVERLVLDVPNQLGKYYSNPLVIILSTFIPILVYGALLLSKNDRKILMFSIIALITTMFSTTINYSWFAPVYKYFWDNFSLFHVFRSPVSFLYLLQFIYSVLLAYLFQQILLKNLSKKIKIGMLSIIFSILIVNGIFVLGLAGHEYNPFPTHTPTMKIPDGYKELGKYLRNNENDESRLLVLPWVGWYVKYSWYDSYDMVDLLHHFSPMNIIGIRNYGPAGIEAQLLDDINTDTINNSISNITRKRMDQLGIKFVLVHKDISPHTYQPLPFAFEKINNYSTMFNKSFIKVMENEYFVLYKSNSTSIALSNYAITNLQLNNSLWEIDKSVIINTKRMNPTYYSGDAISNRTFILILNQNYNPNWRLYVNGEENNMHFKFNQFNGWSINNTGKMNIEIRYTLQKYVLPSILISLISVIFIVVSLLRHRYQHSRIF